MIAIRMRVILNLTGSSGIYLRIKRNYFRIHLKTIMRNIPPIFSVGETVHMQGLELCVTDLYTNTRFNNHTRTKYVYTYDVLLTDKMSSVQTVVDQFALQEENTKYNNQYGITDKDRRVQGSSATQVSSQTPTQQLVKTLIGEVKFFLIHLNVISSMVYIRMTSVAVAPNPLPCSWSLSKGWKNKSLSVHQVEK